jgi:hypothetical protein
VDGVAKKTLLTTCRTCFENVSLTGTRLMSYAENETAVNQTNIPRKNAVVICMPTERNMYSGE